MSYTLANELEDIIKGLRKIDDPVADKAIYAIQKMGRGFNWSGIRKRCWKVSEVRYLTQHVKTKSYEQIANHLGRTREAVIHKAKELRNGKAKI